MKHLLSFAVASIIVSITSSCSLSSKQVGAAQAAVKALHKLAAATQVGDNYQHYSSLTIDAQADVNEALRVLPESELKTEVNKAMEAYADALKAWDEKIRDNDLYKDTEPGVTLIDKYSLETHMGSYYRWRCSSDYALQTIWAVARGHLDRATYLLG